MKQVNMACLTWVRFPTLQGWNIIWKKAYDTPKACSIFFWEASWIIELCFPASSCAWRMVLMITGHDGYIQSAKYKPMSYLFLLEVKLTAVSVPGGQEMRKEKEGVKKGGNQKYSLRKCQKNTHYWFIHQTMGFFSTHWHCSMHPVFKNTIPET